MREERKRSLKGRGEIFQETKEAPGSEGEQAKAVPEEKKRSSEE